MAKPVPMPKTAPKPAATGAMPREQLRTVIVGHVDHGKSSLVGRLFHDCANRRARGARERRRAPTDVSVRDERGEQDDLVVGQRGRHPAMLHHPRDSDPVAWREVTKLTPAADGEDGVGRRRVDTPAA